MSLATGTAAARRPVHRWRRTPVLLGTFVVALVLAVAVVGATALTRIGHGATFWHGPEGLVEATGEIGFFDPASGESLAVYTFVNDGPLPVRVEPVLRDDVATLSVEMLAYPDASAGPDAVFDPQTEPARAAVEVGAGETFAIRVRYAWPPCVEVQPGTGLGVTELTLSATTFLLPRLVTLTLEPQVWLRTSEGRTGQPGCDAGVG